MTRDKGRSGRDGVSGTGAESARRGPKRQGGAVVAAERSVMQESPPRPSAWRPAPRTRRAAGGLRSDRSGHGGGGTGSEPASRARSHRCRCRLRWSLHALARASPRSVAHSAGVRVPIPLMARGAVGKATHALASDEDVGHAGAPSRGQDCQPTLSPTALPKRGPWRTRKILRRKTRRVSAAKVNFRAPVQLAELSTLGSALAQHQEPLRRKDDLLVRGVREMPRTLVVSLDCLSFRRLLCGLTYGCEGEIQHQGSTS